MAPGALRSRFLSQSCQRGSSSVVSRWRSDVLFDEPVKFLTQVGRGVFGPGSRRQAGDWQQEHFLCNLARIIAHGNIGEKAGEANGPEGEVGNGSPDVATGAEVFENRQQ